MMMLIMMMLLMINHQENEPECDFYDDKDDS